MPLPINPIDAFRASRRKPSSSAACKLRQNPSARGPPASPGALLEIDWQGARQVRARLPAARSIFILPPARRALEERLRARSTDSDTVIERRLQDAGHGIEHWREFDYVVINDRFEQALEDLLAIVQGRGAALIPPK